MDASIKTRRTRHQIELSITNTQPWPHVFTGDMDEAKKSVFDNRVKAIKLYAEGESLHAIKDDTGIGCTALHQFIDRCLTISPDGLVWGYRALIPGYRIKEYERNSPIKSKLPEGKGGYSGAFKNLFRKYPELEAHLTKKILKIAGDNVIHEFRISPRHVHRAMLKYLEKENHPKDDWPFNVKFLGIRPLERFVKKVLDANFDRGVLVNGESAARAHLAVGRGEEAILNYEYMMEAAELDSYHIDAKFAIGFENADGLLSYVPIDRINILALVDRASTAIWWFNIVFRSEVSASDVVRLLTESMMAELPRPKSEQLGIKLSGDMGFPTQVFSELAHTIPTVVMPDNALSNLAEAVSSTLRKKVGYSLCYGAPGHFEMRPNVEHAFKEVARLIFQRFPSTTGSGPGSGRAEDADGEAVRLKMDASIIEELVYMHFAIMNATLSEGIFFLSPMEYIRQKLNQAQQHYFPRVLCQESIPEMTNYRVAEKVKVKYYPKAGIRPYIQIDRVRYSSPILKDSAWLSRKEITVEIDEQDMRWVVAYFPDGTLLGNLKASGKWSRTQHSRKTRKLINSLLAQRILIISKFQDPVEEYLRILEEIALGKRAPVKGITSTTAATECARVGKEVAAGMELDTDHLQDEEDEDENQDSVDLSEPQEPDPAHAAHSEKLSATIIPYPMPDLKKIIKGL